MVKRMFNKLGLQTRVQFAKVNPTAKIPTKRREDAGYDIYADFKQDFIAIPPHQTVLIPTGIASACTPDKAFVLKERGSTGSKGIALRMGLLDSGFRGEWQVGWTNTTDNYLFLTKLSDYETYKRYWGDVMLSASYCYPYSKAIAQALIIDVPDIHIEEISYDELKNIDSERGDGMLGSSNK